MNYNTITKASIASHLNILASDIISIASWAYSLYVHIRGIGFRFVSKKIEPTKTTEPKILDLPVNGVISFERFAYDCKHGTCQQHRYLNDNNCIFDRMEGMTMIAIMSTGELIDISPSAVYISLHFNSNAEYNAYYFGK